MPAYAPQSLEPVAAANVAASPFHALDRPRKPRLPQGPEGPWWRR